MNTTKNSRKVLKTCPNCGAQINKPTCATRPQSPYPKVKCFECGVVVNPVCKTKVSKTEVPNRGIRNHTIKYDTTDLNVIGIRCTKIRTQIKYTDGKLQISTFWDSNYNPDKL